MMFAIVLLVLALVGVAGGSLIIRRCEVGSALPGVVIVVLGAVAAALGIALMTFPGVPA